jgi:hypothetical protein
MKRNLNIIIIMLLGMLVFSCKKADFDYPEGMVGSSKITYFPILTLKGERYVAVAKGTAYTEAGVTAKEGSADLTPKTTGTVNTATPGVYTLTYSAVNKDGFSASITRTVVVYSTDAGAAAHDLSGNYARNTNGSIATWTKIAPGVYKVFNPGGAPGTNLTVIAINPTGYAISIPSQISSDGATTSSALEDYSGMPNTYKWQILNPGYGTAVRTFVKQ